MFGPLKLDTEWMMDEGAGRGASKGYEPIVPISEFKALPDIFDPGFTNKYDDLAARRTYVMTHQPEL